MFIRSKRVYIDGKLKPACLSIHTGRIGGIHSYTYMKEEALDAGDWMILPAAIDCHVHMREPEASHKEDFVTGSFAAAAGGVSTFLDMPCYRRPATTTVGALSEKERLASQKSIIDYGFHFGASNENADLIKRLTPASIKLFTCKSNSKLTVTRSGIERHFHSYNDQRPICVHCEDQEVLDENKKKYTEHEKIHSSKASLKAVKDVNKLARKFKRRVHFCHLTTSAEVKAAKQGSGYMRTLDGKVKKGHLLHTCEVTTHHLFLSTSDIDKLKGTSAINPGLRKKADVAALWKSLKQVDCVCSDHAPHLLSEKDNGAPGFAGVQTLYPLMLHAVLGKKIKINDAVRLCCEGPAKAFTIFRKGKIAPGYDADLVIFNPNDHWEINPQDLYSKCGWSPYEGWRLRGKILGTIVRGEQVYWDGEILMKPGFGNNVQRKPQVGSERLVLRKHSKER